MIGNGLTTWLADQLVRKSEFTGDRNKYEMYDLEYSLGLFMNLCQCQTAVQACGSRSRNLFKSLGIFMTTLDVDVSEKNRYDTRINKKEIYYYYYYYLYDMATQVYEVIIIFMLKKLLIILCLYTILIQNSSFSLSINTINTIVF